MAMSPSPQGTWTLWSGAGWTQVQERRGREEELFFEGEDIMKEEEEEEEEKREKRRYKEGI